MVEVYPYRPVHSITIGCQREVIAVAGYHGIGSVSGCRIVSIGRIIIGTAAVVVQWSTADGHMSDVVTACIIVIVTGSAVAGEVTCQIHFQV
jgi:hypothetical protein